MATDLSDDDIYEVFVKTSARITAHFTDLVLDEMVRYNTISFSANNAQATSEVRAELLAELLALLQQHSLAMVIEPALRVADAFSAHRAAYERLLRESEQDYKRLYLSAPE